MTQSSLREKSSRLIKDNEGREQLKIISEPIWKMNISDSLTEFEESDETLLSVLVSS
jgi:hypothetical protein